MATSVAVPLNLSLPINEEQESIQELARKLPEGDALPDGFSDCPTDIPSCNTPTPAPHVGSKTEAPPSFSEEVCSNPFGTLDSCSERSIPSCASPVNDVHIDFSDASSPCCSPSSRREDKRERLRRFPVQLSQPDNPQEALAASVAEVKEAFGNPNDCIGFHGSAVEESKQRGFRGKHSFDVTDDESSPEIDQLISGTAISENGDQTVEGLHSSLLEDEIKDLRKQNELLVNEKLATSAQLTKNLMLREKLESLCRELQRQNKQLSDECKRIASEEQQKRLDLSTKFHDAIKDVTAKLEEQGEERIQQIKENELLQKKLIQFTQQYEVKEQQYAHQLKTKELEQKLLEVKLKQQEEMNKQAETKIQHYAEQMTDLLKTEQDLRSRLALYGDKFEQFQETLTKSNEVFSSFKSEMEKMSKTIKRLEKENTGLQKKCEKSDVTLIELVDERANLRKQLEITKNQKEKLEALCRVLQAERKQQNHSVANVAPSPVEGGTTDVK